MTLNQKFSLALGMSTTCFIGFYLRFVRFPALSQADIVLRQLASQADTVIVTTKIPQAKMNAPITTDYQPFRGTEVTDLINTLHITEKSKPDDGDLMFGHWYRKTFFSHRKFLGQATFDDTPEGAFVFSNAFIFGPQIKREGECGFYCTNFFYLDHWSRKRFLRFFEGRPSKLPIPQPNHY